MASSSSEERSWEDPAIQSGVFTYFLVDGLRGKADVNADGDVTSGELNAYVEKGVVEWGVRNGRAQTPIVSPGFDGTIIIASRSAQQSFLKQTVQSFDDAFSQTRWKDAASAAAALCTAFPDEAMWWNNRAAAESHAGNYPEAVLYYSKAIELFPRYTLAFVFRGAARTRIGSPSEIAAAKLDYDAALAIEPKYVAALENRGYWYMSAIRRRRADLAVAAKAADADFSLAAVLKTSESDCFEGERALAALLVGDATRSLSTARRCLENSKICRDDLGECSAVAAAALVSMGRGSEAYAYTNRAEWRWLPSQVDRTLVPLASRMASEFDPTVRSATAKRRMLNECRQGKWEMVSDSIRSTLGNFDLRVQAEGELRATSGMIVGLGIQVTDTDSRMQSRSEAFSFPDAGVCLGMVYSDDYRAVACAPDKEAIWQSSTQDVTLELFGCPGDGGWSP